MAIVKIKDKYQVTLPVAFREKAGLEIGDMLEIETEGKKITLTPKSLVDRDIEISLRQYREGKGRTFSSAKEAIRYLHQETKRLKRKSV